MNNDSKKFLELVAKLRKRLNSDLTKVESFYQQGIVIHFKNGFKLLISPFSPTSDRSGFTTVGLSVIYDQDFQILNKIVNNVKFYPSYEDGSKTFFNIIQAFSKKEGKSVRKFYDKIFQFELKDLLSKYFNLGVSPRDEYFLFGNDELRPRFSQAGSIKIPKKGIPCRIEDDSAIIIYRENGRIIDLTSPHNGYQDKKYIYYGDVFLYKKCKKEELEYVSYSGKTNKKTYLKKVLKKNVDLKKVKRVPYRNADQMEFILKQDAKGIYSLADKDGEIVVVHPDLLIRVLEKV